MKLNARVRPSFAQFKHLERSEHIKANGASRAEYPRAARQERAKLLFEQRREAQRVDRCDIAVSRKTNDAYWMLIAHVVPSSFLMI
jgi:hypothetical protein